MGKEKKMGKLLADIIGDNAKFLQEQAKVEYSTEKGFKRIKEYLLETKKRLGDMKKRYNL